MTLGAPTGFDDKEVHPYHQLTRGSRFRRLTMPAWSVVFRHLALGLLITGLFLLLAFRQVRWSVFVTEMTAVHERWLAASMVPIPIVLVAMALRWRLLLPVEASLRVWRLARLLSVSYLINLILPGRAGDIARSYAIGRRSRVGFRTALSTVLVEKSLDGVAVLVLVMICISVLRVNGLVASGLVLSTVVFAGVLLGVAGLALWLERRRDQEHRRLWLPLPQQLRAPVWELLERLAFGGQALTRPRRLIPVLALTVMIWLLTLVTTASLEQAFTLELPLVVPAFALALASLSLTVPAAPGGVGAYQALVMFVLERYGVPPAEALGFGIALQFCQILPLAALGVLGLPAEVGELQILFHPRPVKSSPEEGEITTPESGIIEHFRGSETP
ncbi:MAG: flippase-like domain-containing protein [Chloroflexi bacterium]|nr:flippase-like domain-containing protein [Chloroflexota bacterium]